MVVLLGHRWDIDGTPFLRGLPIGTVCIFVAIWQYPFLDFLISYKTAVGIIGDPDKRNPQTRQSADHSMVYIIATLLKKASEQYGYLQDLVTHKFPDVEQVKHFEREFVPPMTCEH